MGMAKRKTIVVPCMVKIWLYCSGESRPFSGLINCVRMSMAMTTAAPKKPSDVQMYMMPIRL
jgi:hypothetical protein